MERLLDVLEATIGTNGTPQTVTEISQATGVPLSTTWRLVSQLASWQFLADCGGGRYAAGPRLVRMSINVTENLHSREALSRATGALSIATGESVTAGLLVGDSLVIVARTESDESLRAVNRIGEVVSPSTSAMGKAILSRLPRERQLAVLRAEVGDRAEDVLDDLAGELAQAHAEGFAVDEETYAVGLRCRAAAVIGLAGHAVAGLSIAGPAARFTPALADQAVTPLLLEAERLSVAGQSFDAGPVTS